jgi:hypothetical protein
MFLVNDLRIDMFIYYKCVHFWKNFKNEFLFVSIEQNIFKKYMLKFDL